MQITKKQATALLKSACTDKARPNLNAVNFRRVGMVEKMEVCDGRTAIQLNRDIEDTTLPDIEAAIPSDTLKQLASSITVKQSRTIPDFYAMNFSDNEEPNGVWPCQVGELSHEVKTIDGQYPNMDMVIPKEYRGEGWQSIQCDPYLLADTLRNLADALDYKQGRHKASVTLHFHKSGNNPIVIEGVEPGTGSKHTATGLVMPTRP